MNPETGVLQAIRLEVGARADVRLFRNNTGVGFVGRVAERSSGRLVLLEPRPLHAGLCKGSSDLIGWRSVVVTAPMVGRRLAVFAAIEAKTGRLQATPEQATFIENVRAAGGLAGVARSVAEAQEIIGHAV